MTQFLAKIYFSFIRVLLAKIYFSLIRVLKNKKKKLALTFLYCRGQET